MGIYSAMAMSRLTLDNERVFYFTKLSTAFRRQSLDHNSPTSFASISAESLVKILEKGF